MQWFGGEPAEFSGQYSAVCVVHCSLANVIPSLFAGGLLVVQ